MKRTTTIIAGTLAATVIFGAGVGAQPLFRDVGPSDTHAEGINWAANHGVIVGYPDGTFRPDKCVTRGQLASMLHRFERLPRENPDE